MRLKITGFIALLAVLYMAPAVSHHAAEGIISDDVWDVINDNLELVDSPHLNIDFDDVMGSMRVSEDSDRGSLFLVTSATVLMEDVDDYVAQVEIAIDAVLAAMGEAGMAPPGLSGSGNANTLSYEVIDLEDGYAEIVLFEPIGAVNSQSPTNPGKSSR
jgi:hypothetical protein